MGWYSSLGGSFVPWYTRGYISMGSQPGVIYPTGPSGPSRLPVVVRLVRRTTGVVPGYLRTYIYKKFLNVYHQRHEPPEVATLRNAHHIYISTCACSRGKFRIFFGHAKTDEVCRLDTTGRRGLCLDIDAFFPRRPFDSSCSRRLRRAC